MGIPRLGSRAKGDQVLVVKLLVPKHMNKRQKEILKEFEELSKEGLGEGIKNKFKNMFTGTA
jgi:molecular chaperone DnaJ